MSDEHGRHDRDGEAWVELPSDWGRQTVVTPGRYRLWGVMRWDDLNGEGRGDGGVGES